MIVTTFNVRGLGGRVKKNKIRDLSRSNKVAVQETKLQEITPALCYSLWGGEHCDWAFRPSEGNSGGILSLWRKSSDNFLFSFQEEGYVGVCLEWGWRRRGVLW
jgi:exonuclease III